MLFYVTPFLLGLIPGLFLWVKNVAEVHVKKILFFSFYYLICYSVVFYFVLQFFSLERTALILADTVLFVFYGKVLISNALEKKKQDIALLFFMAVFLFVPQQAAVYLMYGCFAVFVFVLLVFLHEYGKYLQKVRNASVGETEIKEDLSLKEGISLPNIYYFIPDSYGGAAALNAYCGDDNMGFMAWLTKQGFKIDFKAKPNYSHTHYSLPSTLNMNYLVNFFKYEPTESVQMNLGRLVKRQYNNKVVRILKKLGYHTIHIVNDYDKFYLNKQDYGFDEKIDFAYSFNFEFALFHNTFLRKPIRRICRVLMRRSLLKTFDFLENYNYDASSRKFMYCHLMCPHHPFYFDENGRLPKSDYDYDNPEVYPKMYMDQIRYLNTRFMRIIKKIKADDPNAVIILQADHGGPIKMLLGGSSEEIISERYSVLRAIYAPKGYDLDFVSNVNLFPTIFNNWLQEPMKIKKDLYWYILDNKDFKMVKLDI